MTELWNYGYGANFTYNPIEWKTEVDRALLCGCDAIKFGFGNQSFVPGMKDGTKPEGKEAIDYAKEKGLNVCIIVNINAYPGGRHLMPQYPESRAMFIDDVTWLIDNWTNIDYIEMEEPAIYNGDVNIPSYTQWLTNLFREIKLYITENNPNILYGINFPSNWIPNIIKNSFDYETINNERIFEFYQTQSGNVSDIEPGGPQIKGDIRSLYKLKSACAIWESLLPNSIMIADCTVATSQTEGSVLCEAQKDPDNPNSFLAWHFFWPCYNQAFLEQLQWTKDNNYPRYIYSSGSLYQANRQGVYRYPWPVHTENGLWENIYVDSTNPVYSVIKEIIDGNITIPYPDDDCPTPIHNYIITQNIIT